MIMRYFLKAFYIIIFIKTFIRADNVDFTKKEILKIRQEVKAMFYHAYEGYMKYAIPYDELRPLTCDGHDTWGSYSLTLIDALDTLAVMENKTEFQRVYNLIAERSNFEADINVSVFETNIRIVGGLLSGHLLARKMEVDVEEGWPCKGPLLKLAVDAATRLLPAFDTPTGMPYGTVNLKNGVPNGETPITCAAGVGTFIIEFGTISRLTGDTVFEKIALRAIHNMWDRRSRLNLIGNHIDVLTGQWTGNDAGIGAGVDSYFEYLVKGSFLFQRPELMSIFKEARHAIDKNLRHEDWYLWKSMQRGQVSMALFQSLEAFWPGILTVTGDTESAQKTLFNYHQVLKQYGFTPEFYSIPQGAAYVKRSGYPLRPELVESLMYVYQATKDHTFLKMGADLVKSIEYSTKTECGYATVENVIDHSLDNRMESFFLAETTKYLYLLFSEDHWLHSSGDRGIPFKVEGHHCIIEGGGYFFNTEAHPIDAGALNCCSRPEEKGFLLQQDIVNLILDPTSFVESGTSSLPINGGTSNSKMNLKRKNVLNKSFDDIIRNQDEHFERVGSKLQPKSNFKYALNPKPVNILGNKSKFEEQENLTSNSESEASSRSPESFETAKALDVETRDINETVGQIFTSNIGEGFRDDKAVLNSQTDAIQTEKHQNLKESKLVPEKLNITENFSDVFQEHANDYKDQENSRDDIFKDQTIETAKGEISNLVMLEKLKNISEYEGGASNILKDSEQGGLPWGPRFSTVGEGDREKDSPIEEMSEVTTSVSSSKFSHSSENRILQKDEPETELIPQKIFSLEQLRKTVYKDILSLKNRTEHSCPSVLKCPISFTENFSYKGQMINS